MPNWCTNHLSIDGPEEEIERFLKAAKGKGDWSDCNLSFQSLAPCPQALLDATSGSLQMGYEAKYTDKWETIAGYPWVRDANDGVIPGTRDKLLVLLETLQPEAMGLADQYKANFDAHGCITWYEWCIEHWGTRWDCNDGHSLVRGSRENLYATFDTAWSPPIALFDKVAEDFPKLEFGLQYYEMGCDFAGLVQWFDGQRNHEEEGKPCEYDFVPPEYFEDDEEDECVSLVEASSPGRQADDGI
jgi:hypothetical protein